MHLLDHLVQLIAYFFCNNRPSMSLIIQLQTTLFVLPNPRLLVLAIALSKCTCSQKYPEGTPI